MKPLTIAIAGGVPAALGGGGLERQAQRTASALTARGHDVFRVGGDEARRFDLLHVFSSGPDVQFWVSHWRRNTGVPLVVSPVLVVAPGAPELRQRVAHSLPLLPEFGPRERRALLRRADAIVALTDHEASLLRRLGGHGAPDPVVIGNGADPVPGGQAPPGLPDEYVVLVGTVSERKRQRETVAQIAAAGGPAPVVAGGFEGSDSQRALFESAVDAAGGVWIDEIASEPDLRAVVRRARALVHLSRAEGQSLAILEALAEGTPVVASPLPANRELAERYPEHVRLADSGARLATALEALAERGSAPAVPTWDDVAAQLESLYATLT